MNSAYKHLLGHHPSTFVVDDDVENDNDVVDEDESENEDVEEDVLDYHEQDLCVSIPLSRVVKIFLFTFTFHSRFKLSDCKV